MDDDNDPRYSILSEEYQAAERASRERFRREREATRQRALEEARQRRWRDPFVALWRRLVR